MRPRGGSALSSRRFCGVSMKSCKMSRKCQAKECSFCASKFLGRRHRHTEGWSPSLVAFLEEESGLNAGNQNMCVCEACRSSIRNSMKARDDGEPYQLRWLKDKRVSQCCVPSCSSVDIKAEKHEFTWEVICDSVEIVLNLQGTLHCV